MTLLITTEIPQTTIDRFWETVPVVWSLVRRKLRGTACEQFDVSEEQFHILRHVRRGARSVSDLAEAKRISRPAISRGVEGLVEKGLLTRATAAADRRCVLLSLTPAGDALLTAIFQENRAWMSERLAALSPADLETINAALPLLRAAFTAGENED